MTYQSAYRSTHRRHRHRRRNSHYGVLVALILVIIVAVPVGFHVVKSLSSAIFGGDRNQLVYQIDNSRAAAEGAAVDLNGAAPFRDGNGVVFVPLQSLCDRLGLELSWEADSRTAVITEDKNTLRLQMDSKTVRLNEEDQTISAAPLLKDGTAYVPVGEIGRLFSWQVGELGADKGDLIVVSQSKKALDDEKLSEIASDAVSLLGPSRQQLDAGSVLMRTGSDKLQYGGEVRRMQAGEDRRSAAVLEQDGLQYVPLEAAVTALDGTASFADGEWTVEVNGIHSTVQENGKAKVDGDRVRGDRIRAFTDEESGRFYVSTQLFASLIGKFYTGLEDGAFVFADMALDAFDSQKAYLAGKTGGLTQAVGASIPQADVYIALTFDDGPTGAVDGYPEGLTAHLLDGLKERGAHATFFMVGNRTEMFSSTLPRLAAEGHEVGNHTMTHPMQHLTGLDADGIRQEISAASETIAEKAGQMPTVMRPVGGGVNSEVKAIAKELGLPIINWNLDTQDWSNRNQQSVHDAIVKAEDGAVVLMHDLYPTTVEAALSAIDELQSRTDKTYAFVTVSELAAVKGITLEPGVVYNGLTDQVAEQIANGTYAPTEFT